jgi:phage baseplate assembly protein W
MDINGDIIGRGWSFPPTFNNISGEVQMTEGKDDIDGSLYILLNTAFGERVMLSKYGCDLRKFLFEPSNGNMLVYIQKIVTEAILYYEPRINAGSITVNGTDGLLEIDIEYTIKANNSRSNYVFPFYLSEASL